LLGECAGLRAETFAQRRVLKDRAEPVRQGINVIVRHQKTRVPVAH
jgi:hypothetical protein